MAPQITENGLFNKLIFQAFRDSKFTEPILPLGTYEVQYNPESFDINLVVEHEEKQPPGTDFMDLRYKRTKPKEYKFEFIIDGTGIYQTLVPVDVTVEIERFLRVVYNVNSDEHRPNYVMIIYGTLILKCVLTSLDIKYYLFTPEGLPLRAKLTCRFSSSLHKTLGEMILNLGSPDLTHRRSVAEGDTVAGMSNHFYKSPFYYIELADANDLDNFRQLEPGSDLYVPPLK